MNRFGLLYSLGLGAFVVVTATLGVTVAPPDAAACSPEPQMPVFPREAQEVPTDVVVQALDWGSGLDAAHETFADWTLTDAAGDEVDFDLVVVDERLAQMHPTALLTPGAYTLHAPRFTAWETPDIHFVVVDEEAPQLPPPDMAPSGQQVFHDEGTLDCGSLGTYQSFTAPANAYALRVMTSSTDVGSLQSIGGGLDDVAWRSWGTGEGLYLPPATTTGVRFGGFDAAGRFTGWGPTHVVTSLPLEAGQRSNGCSSSSSSSPSMLGGLALLLWVRRRRQS